MARAVDDVTRNPWIEVATYATLFGVGLPSAYRDAREGRFGAFKVGVMFRFPSPPVRDVLHLQAAPIVPTSPLARTEMAAA